MVLLQCKEKLRRRWFAAGFEDDRMLRPARAPGLEARDLAGEGGTANGAAKVLADDITASSASNCVAPLSENLLSVSALPATILLLLLIILAAYCRAPCKIAPSEPQDGLTNSWQNSSI